MLMAVEPFMWRIESEGESEGEGESESEGEKK